MGGGGRRRLAGNGIARPGPDHLLWEHREEGITAMEEERAAGGAGPKWEDDVE